MAYPASITFISEILKGVCVETTETLLDPPLQGDMTSLQGYLFLADLLTE